MAEHGVEFVQLGDPGLEPLDRHVELGRQFARLVHRERDELVERRIEKADRHRPAFHGLEDPDEILALVGQDLRERGPALLDGLGHDHLAHRLDALRIEEHVLGAAEPDALGAEHHRLVRVLGPVRVGADAEPARLVGELHEFLVPLVALGFGRDELLPAEVHDALGAVERDVLPFAHDRAADAHLLGARIDVQRAAAHDAALAPATGHQRRVAGHAALRREDRLRGVHAVDILGRGLGAHQDDLLAARGPLLRIIGREHGLARRAAGARGQALGQNLRTLLGVRIDHGQEQLVELRRRHAHERLVEADQPLRVHLDGHAHGRRAVALARAGLEHPEHALLDRELDVLHVAVVLLQPGADGIELPVGLGVGLLEALEVLVARGLRRDVDRRRRPDAGDDILALGVLEPLAVEELLARRRIAREGHAGRRIGAHVAEHHRLHVDGRAPVIGQALDAAVRDGALAHPGLEHGADAAPELGGGVIGKLRAEHFLDLRLEDAAQRLEILCRELRVLGHAARVLHALQFVLEDQANAVAAGGLDAGGLLHDDV